MNKVWEIIEHRKEHSSEGKSPIEEYRMGRKSGMRMSGRKSEEYERGMKDGFCAAVKILEDVADSFDED